MFTLFLQTYGQFTLLGSKSKSLALLPSLMNLPTPIPISYNVHHSPLPLVTWQQEME